MELKKRLMEQAFCLPQGVVGRLGGRLMALDRVLPAWVLTLLEVGPSDSVLEVGSGPGLGLALAAALVREGQVVGLDPSATMLGMARDRNRQGIEAGHVELHLGDAANLPFDDATFDVAFTINSLHLWPDPVAGLREVRRTLRRGGRIGVAISRFSYASADRFGDHLINAGFEDVSVHTGDRGTCLIART
ncbi:MAG: methyltransferase domain-containing protein [Chloroflexi bacterium]|nr:methyltransferase domain-containing protein [Chloroflexota bacterium]MCI0646534.1 methyltransferase domain-containing protein [Chloroflexota bacterium]MCI0726336.1 methyltransferase domain-containing protein [Chloroflexota bacterium]